MKYIKIALDTIKALWYYLTTKLKKKDKYLWVFGAWKGQAYSDNSKYLYEYVLNSENNIRAVWITKNIEIYKKLLSENKNVALWPSREAKRIVSKASVIFQTEGNRDIGEYRVGGAQIVQLWHGMFLKNTPWYEGESTLKKRLINIYSNYHAKSKWISISDYYTKDVSRILGVPIENFILTGYPRNDSFAYKPRNIVVSYLEKNYPGHKYVIYLPTHRSFGESIDLDFILNGLKLLDERFASENIVLVYKPHQNEIDLLRKEIQTQELGFHNIIIANGSEYNDLYSYLHRFDCLISDYSSVIYDFLACDRPIVLFNYDIKEYEDKYGKLIDLYYDYKVGPSCESWEDLVTIVLEQLKNDMWTKKRRLCNSIVNLFNDGGNCKRIVDAVYRMNDTY